MAERIAKEPIVAPADYATRPPAPAGSSEAAAVLIPRKVAVAVNLKP
ncbi:hypothetical protein [Sorangium cellulosum]|nr:hypothetical protein [Sorangium cellulosum]